MLRAFISTMAADIHSGLQRYDWTGEARELENDVDTHEGRPQITCRLVTHPLGWELRLDLAPDRTFLESRACKVERDVFDTSDAWQGTCDEKGLAF